MPRVDAYASQRHYADHIAPVWAALPDHLRGTFWSRERGQEWGTPLHQRRDPANWVLVAGRIDELHMAGQPLVYLEHGAGQTYDGDPAHAGNPSYAGGKGHDWVRLFLCPNEHVADAWRAKYRAAAVVVGCPRLDRWHTDGGHHRATPGHPPMRPGPVIEAGRAPVVAVTFHWQCALVPETMSAWRYYDPVLPRLVNDQRWSILGHGHPRLWPTIQQRWRRLGARHVARLDDVIEQADVLVADNTSALYEFASVGKPVVVLNAPWYRRDVHHGLRFWSHVPGPQVDHPNDLPDVIDYALGNADEWAPMRQLCTERVYAHTDGLAATRAATAIEEAINA